MAYHQPPKLIVLALAASAVASYWVAGRVNAEDWPQWRGPGRDGVWHVDGLITIW